MFVIRLEHPPLHAQKLNRFKLHETDYFGAYDKLHVPSTTKLGKKKVVEDEMASEEQSFVVINQMELDDPKQIKALEKLLVGIDGMRPKLVVCIGKFFSEKVLETETFEDFKKYFEALGQVVKDN
jgi:hypothetical protein